MPAKIVGIFLKFNKDNYFPIHVIRSYISWYLTYLWVQNGQEISTEISSAFLPIF